MSTSALLTLREEQVLRRTIRGAPQKTIARELSIAVRTVQDHAKRGLAKLGGHARLMEHAERAGWLDPPSLADVIAASRRLVDARAEVSTAERELRAACMRLVEARGGGPA